jgi:predicted transposase YbfD/YdcC
MNSKAQAVAAHFAALTDPRVKRTRLHKLIDIVVVAIAGVIAGADSWDDIERYGLSKEIWLRQFLELPSGIPSHDTFARVFARLDPATFQTCFLSWMTAVSGVVKGLVPIDGKTLRGSGVVGGSPLHLVQAWSVENSVVLGQVSVADKSNEIVAIPELLKLLDISGCLVTIDAIGCQRAIAAEIVAAGGDYVLAVKGNQQSLDEQIRQAVEGATPEALTARAGGIFETVEKGHGRIESRRYWLLPAQGIVDCLDAWAGMLGVGVAESLVEQGSKTTTERRYFIVSFSGDGGRFGQAVRSHWQVESMHWTLDMSFGEDRSRIRKDHSPANMGIMRRMALTLLKQAPTKRASIHGRRLEAGWNDDYMRRVLLGRGAPPTTQGLQEQSR